jgi:hypothetical protein
MGGVNTRVLKTCRKKASNPIVPAPLIHFRIEDQADLAVA